MKEGLFPTTGYTACENITIDPFKEAASTPLKALHSKTSGSQSILLRVFFAEIPKNVFFKWVLVLQYVRVLGMDRVFGFYRIQHI